MADNPKPGTPHLAQTTSAPSARTQPLLSRSNPRSSSASAAPRLDALADVGLGLGTTYFKSGMPPLYQPISLTGAAAEADLRREKELDEARKARMTSVNPAAQTKATLLGQPMGFTPNAARSTPKRSPPQQATQVLSSNVSVTPRMQPPATTRPTSPPRRPFTPKVSQPSQVHSENPRKRLASPKTDERSSKAMTFPPPPSSDVVNAGQPDSGRHMSLKAPSSSTPGPSRTSSTTKKHKCPHCATEFTRHHNLKSHLLTHSQEKPFGCQECSSRFRRLHDLKRHLKLHTGERPHICPNCGRKFARGDALARHGKGPGGCAGRRSSQGEDDEDEDEEGPEDITMTEEPEDDLRSSQRRQSAPNHDVPMSSPNSYRTWSSSYPPQLTRQNSSTTTLRSRPAYPPRPSVSSARTSRETSYAMSPTATSASNPFLSLPFPSPSTHNPATSGPAGAVSLFPGTMVTESPKPLSPGQGDPMNTAASETSLSTKMHQTQLQPRLPPPTQHTTTLPSLASLSDQRYQGGPIMHPPPPPPPLSTTQPPFSPGIGVQPAISVSGPTSAISSSTSHSLSSNGPLTGSAGSLREMYPIAAQHESRSSAGSIRDIHSSEGLGGRSNNQDSAAVSYIRGIERREQEAQAEIAHLRNEVEFLKAQVLQLQAQLHRERQSR